MIFILNTRFIFYVYTIYYYITYKVTCDIHLQTPSPAYTLNVGSRIYIDNNVLTRQRYAATVKSFYDTDVINDNMSDVQTVATKINSWISNITDGHIQKMIGDGESISRGSRICLDYD